MLTAILRFDSGDGHPYRRNMTVFTLAELAAETPPGAPWFGLDLGERTIGVAASDASRTIASPLEVIRRTRFTPDAERLFALMEARGAGGLVVGLPLNMDGTEGPRAQSARAFVRNLARLRPVRAAFWDERLSTAGVERFLIEEMDLSRARRAQVVDRNAAAFILQGALDRLAHSP